MYIYGSQFPLTCTSTVNEVQGPSLGQSVIDFDLPKQKLFGLDKFILCSVGQQLMLIFIGEFKKSVIKVNKVALLEYKRLKQSNLFSTIRNFISGDTLTGFVSNVRSFPRHLVI